MADPLALQVIAASDTSTTISSLATVTKTAAGGLYPIEYTVYHRGTYVMSVTGADGQVNERHDTHSIQCTRKMRTSAASLCDVM